MSFSSKTKNEVARIDVEDFSCKLAEIAAIVRMSGTIQVLDMGKFKLKLTTENAATARRTFTLLRELYKDSIGVVAKRSKHLKKNNNYLISIKNPVTSKTILEDIGFIDDRKYNIFNPNYKVPRNIIKNRACKRAYIRGAFLGGASISNPEKAYHLEFVTNNKEHSRDLSNIINSFALNSKIVQRKDNYIVYLKEGEQIVDLLNIIGAHQALLQVENIRVLKDVRNNINRIVNCETANLGKTINASMRQVEDIKFIQNNIGLEKLPQNLRDVAEVRLENRDASLKEIGQMLNPPVGKSGVNHRFRRIKKIVEELEGRNNGKSKIKIK